MLIKDTLQRNPATHPLVNQGQARIADQPDEQTWRALAVELSTFVCEGQYEDGLQRLLTSYLADLSHPSQNGVWVSGFYGSGKSHLLKMLCHLWQNTILPDGSSARSLVPTLPSDIQAALKELDVAGKRCGGTFAAAGSMQTGDPERPRSAILSIVLRSAGLPESWAQAQFCLWLIEEGHFDKFKAAVKAAGKEWHSELNRLYVSPVIANAVLACDPHFAATELDAKDTIKKQFQQPVGDVTTRQFLDCLKRVLRLKGRDGQFPCTVIVLDEVQAYIGTDSDRAGFITEAAESINHEMGSQVMIVAAGQNALTDTSTLQKLLARFRIKIPLMDTDVEVVTRKVLLQKQPQAIAPIRQVLSKYAGEISRHLANTKIEPMLTDDQVAVDDYPLLPVRRRFWEHCFRQVDPTGTNSQLRSQLGIVHEAVSKLVERPIGALIPTEALYQNQAPAMVTSGVLPRELHDRIANLGLAEGTLAGRLCALIFLVGMLPRKGGADIGVRSTASHLADLVVNDLTADNGKLRSDVATELQKLVAGGTLMLVDNEFRLQTREGADWDQEFKTRRTKFANSAADLQHKQDHLLYAELDRIVKSVKVMQGAAREVRQFGVYREDTPPKVAGDNIPVWVRDQWSCSPKEHETAAQRAGLESPILFVFIPKRSPDQLRDAIVDAEAAEQTLGMRGIPSTAEGMEARRGMESRRDLAVRMRDELVRLEVAGAKVFQGGGSEILQITLEDKLKEGASSSLARLYPQFGKADAPASAWEAVIKRAREGADHPMQPVGHPGPTDQHPVSQQVMATIGAGKTGADVRKELEASPYGWPRDAIDATLISLHRSQHLSVTLNGSPVAAGALDQNKISKAEFRREHDTVAATDRIALRGLFQSAGVNCKSNEEVAKAPEFVATVSGLLACAGGPPPFPEAPSLDGWDKVQAASGNAQLLAILAIKDALENGIPGWRSQANLIQERRSGWDQAEQLAAHARHLNGGADLLRQLDQIRDERLVLEANDPVEPVRTKLTHLLRSALHHRHARHEEAWKSALDSLTGSETWQRLDDADRNRILSEVALSRPSSPDVSSADSILTTLGARTLEARQSEIDAVSGRAARALELAARQLEPKVQLVAVDSATLKSEADIVEWLSRQEARLRAALKHGPVLVK